MVCFPNCKINIGLQVAGRRPDGYRELQTIFYPVAIKDVLEVIDDPQANDINLFASGLFIEGAENNLCIKAYHLLKRNFPHLPAVKMHLHKVIPIGAGLGGGSADAAFTLQLINEKYALKLSSAALKEYALELGSDCPFFLIDKPCFATGRGEKLQEIAIDLFEYKIVIVNPGIHINTGWAFSMLENKLHTADLEQNIKQPVKEWRNKIYNDLEKPVFDSYPEIKSLKESLYSSGAIYAAMSGSGSSVYGIFEKKKNIDLSFPVHYFYRWV